MKNLIKPHCSICDNVANFECWTEHLPKIYKCNNCSKEKVYLETLLTELQETWDLTEETINDIAMKMCNYALAATMDSHIRKETEEKCAEYYSNK